LSRIASSCAASSSWQVPQCHCLLLRCCLLWHIILFFTSRLPLFYLPFTPAGCFVTSCLTASCPLAMPSPSPHTNASCGASASCPLNVLLLLICSGWLLCCIPSHRRLSLCLNTVTAHHFRILCHHVCNAGSYHHCCCMMAVKDGAGVTALAVLVAAMMSSLLFPIQGHNCNWVLHTPP
jgi:hypothetical protein